MARTYTETINEKTSAYFTGRTAEVSRVHEEEQAAFAKSAEAVRSMNGVLASLSV